MLNNKFLFAVCFFGVSFFSWSQKGDRSNFGYGMSFGLGNAKLEHNQLGVLNGDLLVLKFHLDYSFSDNRKTKVLTGIQFLDFNAQIFNLFNQSKFKNEYLQIPLKLTHRIGLSPDGKLNFATGIGAYGNFLMRSEVFSPNQKINNKSGGFNWCYVFTLGAEYQLSSDTSLKMHCDLMNEISTIKRNGFEQKQTDMILMSIGFQTRF
jgi:hypothetical protein